MTFTKINGYRCAHCDEQFERLEELYDEHLQNGACVVLGP